DLKQHGDSALDHGLDGRTALERRHGSRNCPPLPSRSFCWRRNGQMLHDRHGGILMNRIARAIERIILGSRWLVAPFLLGLIIGLGALLYTFIIKLIGFVATVNRAPEDQVIVGVLKLVDLSLTANLLLIVIASSYQNFVAHIATADHPRWPGGLIGIGFAGL